MNADFMRQSSVANRELHGGRGTWTGIGLRCALELTFAPSGLVIEQSRTNLDNCFGQRRMNLGMDPVVLS